MKQEKAQKQIFSSDGIIVITVILVILAILIVPAYLRLRDKFRANTCVSNQKQIAMAVMMYVEEHNDTTLPREDFWSIINVSPKILKCPSASRRIPNSYGHNISISGLYLGAIHDPTEVFLTADALPKSGNIISIDNGAVRHYGKKRLIASFVDGHVEVMRSAPTTFIYASTRLAKGLAKNKNIYTTNGKYNAAHWSLDKLSDNSKIPANNKSTKLIYDGNLVSIFAVGDKASAVAKVYLPAFYPKGVKEASEYWAFDTKISLENCDKAGKQTEIAIIFLDEKDRDIAEFYVLREFADDSQKELSFLNCDSNTIFTKITGSTKKTKIILRDEQIPINGYRTADGDEYDFTYEKPFTPLTITAYNNTIYVSYGNSSGKATLATNKANWKKPTTLKIVCFENESKDVANSIMLKDSRFVIK